MHRDKDGNELTWPQVVALMKSHGLSRASIQLMWTSHVETWHKLNPDKEGFPSPFVAEDFEETDGAWSHMSGERTLALAYERCVDDATYALLERNLEETKRSDEPPPRH